MNEKEKDLLWKEEFSFELAVPPDPEKRPFIYFNNDLTKMLVQH